MRNYKRGKAAVSFVIFIALVLSILILQTQITLSVSNNSSVNRSYNESSEFNNITIDPLVTKKLQNQTEVYVTVMLKDDSNVTYANTRRTVSERRSIYEEKAVYFNQVQERVIVENCAGFNTPYFSAQFSIPKTRL